MKRMTELNFMMKRKKVCSGLMRRRMTVHLRMRRRRLKIHLLGVGSMASQTVWR